ncbi:polyphosphate:AMP phosphotransferase [Leptolyngbya sp. 'hensonii']|uniref:polyphosphate:AMP phosphotransferase n=1 Tax=Leptolyngbya sp. 'hensonii' TaxID=1922337 RepID=UPI00094FD315|nr:polyphosphate:AMP phosphotransferase [Leptolyngbya sp. 'hensonii']OLP19115.1 polyphosphate:AMP phosphotransferase [Leptolyngbya sp. 'hensonii']
MLDTLDLHLSLDKATYQTEMERLMMQLRSLQNACWEKKMPVIVVLEGWAASGKGALVKKMIAYMDPRGFQVHPIWPSTKAERQYPFLWRFWKKLPARGAIAFYYHSWYTHVLEDRLFDRIAVADVPAALAQINAFERHLVDDGAAIAKFWIHLSRKELKQRLQEYAAHPLTAWRVRSEDWQQEKNYDRYTAYAEEMLVQTSTGSAPWTLVEGNSQRWARVKVLTQLTATLTEALDRLHLQFPVPTLPPQAHLEPTEPDILAQVDFSHALSESDYRQQLGQVQVQLRKLQLSIYRYRIPVLVLFEGWDAAGKGGAIKRLTDILDPRSYFVHPFAAPTDEEKAHHYLWRFWRQLPTSGTIGIFDRSWYGRVLVERVEGFATETEWRRAYREINEFEAQLTSAGYVLVKIWLHISPEEQMKRFLERRDDQFKEYKLTDEDWRNRDKWPYYEVAVNQALQRTSTPNAPWAVISANDKYYARVQVIQTVVAAIRAELNRRKCKK